MRRLKLIAVIIAGFGLLAFAAGSFCFSYYFAQTKKTVKVEFKYMQYACGECYPQWNVLKVYGDNNMSNRFYDKDMQVYYKGKKLDDVLNDDDWNCIICSKFIITGIVEKTLSNKYRFIADKYQLMKDKSCCE